MSLRKITSLSSFGAALEYYDFVIYATLAHTLSELFFPQTDSHINLLKAFAIFAIGYLVRPIGGVIFATFGDRFGRKNVFILSITLMALSTFAIGLLPNYSQIGVLAPILLIVFRIIQGISFGSELPGAITFLSEHAYDNKPGLHVAWMICGVSFGAVLSSALYTLLNYYFSHQAILDYAWRLPFLLGGLLGVLGYFLRRHTAETPLFKRSNAHQFTLALLTHLFTKFWRQLALGILITLFGGTLIISYLYLPSLISNSHIKANDSSLAFTIGFTWSAFLIPICGLFTDKYGALRCFTLTFICALILAYPMYFLLQTSHWILLLAFTLIYQTITSFLAVNYSVILSELFPTKVRYTGVAICYNTAFALAGFIPIFLTALLSKSV